MPGNFRYPYFFAINLSVLLTINIPYSAASSSINSMCRKTRRESGSSGSSEIFSTQFRFSTAKEAYQILLITQDLQNTTDKKSFVAMYSNNVSRSISSMDSSSFWSSIQSRTSRISPSKLPKIYLTSISVRIMAFLILYVYLKYFVRTYALQLANRTRRGE